MSLNHAIDEARKKGMKVTACMGNPFLEFPMAACPFLVRPETHSKWVCADPESWKMKGVDYVFDKVTEVDPDTKTIKFSNPANEALTYKVLIVATGSKMPLIIPNPGDSLEQRVDQVKQAGAAIARAQTVVCSGAGLVGLEMAGDIRAAHPFETTKKRIVLLSRDGGVLRTTHPPEWQERVKKVLDKMNIEVVQGSIPTDFTVEPKLEAGGLNLDSGEMLKYDVFIPCFALRPNTDFFDGSRLLNERNQIETNECLQSKAYPDIFGVGVTSIPLLGHPVSARMTAQAKTCVKNALHVLEGKAVVPHVDKESPPPSALPMTVKIGHGKGGYMIWDEQGFPCPVKCCCCTWCHGGFPFCPPPCCWCCAKGCPSCCGSCGGPAEGEAAAVFMLEFMLPKFMGPHLYKGAGKAPQQLKMG